MQTLHNSVFSERLSGDERWTILKVQPPPAGATPKPTNHDGPRHASCISRTFRSDRLFFPARRCSTQGLQPGFCYIRLARLASVRYRVILQGVDPLPACHITFLQQPARLAGDPHPIWQVPARQRDFSIKAPLVSTRKTPQRHKYNVDLSRLPRKVDKPAKAFLGSS